MPMDSTVEERAIFELMQLMLLNNYSNITLRKHTDKILSVDKKCVELAAKDFPLELLQNTNGSLCNHYPPSILIPKSGLVSHSCGETNLPQLEKSVSLARFARCRGRFVVPAFMVRGKNVCRSATLSGSLEVYGRQVANAAGFTFDGLADEGPVTPAESETGRSTFDRLRDEDCQVLKQLRVTYICDLMLEHRKVKYWLPVSSSEKADTHLRYSDFILLPMPYPGSEFFRIWRDSNYAMTDVFFDWNQPGIDVDLRSDCIPVTLMSQNIDWSAYKDWDLTTLTTNYLKLILGLIYEGGGGILLHCISGWDRTPLFISLIRCLLWADGLTHCSLTPPEMLYFTLAYDWFLFGHQLRTRQQSGEEVLRFTFHLLAEFAKQTDLSLRTVYDISMLTSDSSETEKNGDDCVFVDLRSPEELSKARQEKLNVLTGLFQLIWNDVIRTEAKTHSTNCENESAGVFSPSPDSLANSTSSNGLFDSSTLEAEPNSATKIVAQLAGTMASISSNLLSGVLRPFSTENQPTSTLENVHMEATAPPEDG